MTTATREFTFLKLRMSALTSWAFPRELDDSDPCPFAGTLTREQVRSLEKWVALFPFAHRVGKSQRAFRVFTPAGERADIRLTSDGQIWASGAMRLIYGLFVQLQAVCPELVAEEPESGLFFDRDALEWEARRTPLPWRAVA